MKKFSCAYELSDPDRRACSDQAEEQSDYIAIKYGNGYVKPAGV
jgi:hypothetical protein